MRIPLAIILVIAVALPTGSFAATGTAGQIVTGKPGASMEVTPPGSYFWGTLSVGASGNISSPQVVNIKSNDVWGIQIHSSNSNGRFEKYTTGTYQGQELTNAIQYQVNGSAYKPLSGAPATVLSAQPVTANTGADVNFTYKQIVTYTDEQATYRVDLVYTAVQGL